MLKYIQYITAIGASFSNTYVQENKVVVENTIIGTIDAVLNR